MNLSEPTPPVAAPPDVWIGIDIAKGTFEAGLLRASGKLLVKGFANDASGFANLVRWIEELAPRSTRHCCMEATGSSYLACAEFLAVGNLRVSVVNPYRIKHAGFTYGQGNKTDKADARTLSQYCRKEQPLLWRAAAPEIRVLVALLRRVDALQTQHSAELNRLQDPGLLEMVRPSLQASLDFLAGKIARLQQQVHAHPALQADKKLLLSIPGIGESTAHWLL